MVVICLYYNVCIIYFNFACTEIHDLRKKTFMNSQLQTTVSDIPGIQVHMPDQTVPVVASEKRRSKRRTSEEEVNKANNTSLEQEPPRKPRKSKKAPSIDGGVCSDEQLFGSARSTFAAPFLDGTSSAKVAVDRFRISTPPLSGESANYKVVKHSPYVYFFVPV